MCKALRTTRSGYYAWLKNSNSKRAEEDKILTSKIRFIFIANRNVYGARRIKIELEKQNLFVSRKRIARLMKDAGLVCKIRPKLYRYSKNLLNKNKVKPNLLLRNFKVNEKDLVWVGDITYIRTLQGWLYLATVIDLYSRKVVGWSMDNNIKAELVNSALLMAIWKRKPKKGLIWHTDRGSQYSADSHSLILKNHHIIKSMSRKGDCWDNAVAESFFKTLKTELTNHCKFKTIEEAKMTVFEYIEVFYNRKRLHSANGYLSPAEFESKKHQINLPNNYCPNFG